MPEGSEVARSYQHHGLVELFDSSHQNVNIKVAGSRGEATGRKAMLAGEFCQSRAKHADAWTQG
jgi:hypothetical protein